MLVVQQRAVRVDPAHACLCAVDGECGEVSLDDVGGVAVLRCAALRHCPKVLWQVVVASKRERRAGRDDDGAARPRVVGEHHPARSELVTVLLGAHVARRLLGDATAPHTEPRTGVPIHVALVWPEPKPLHDTRCGTRKPHIETDTHRRCLVALSHAPRPVPRVTARARASASAKARVAVKVRGVG